jgi:hypothetical protein
MDSVQALHDRANAELRLSIERIDKELRPLQRAYFRCCFSCSDDTRPSDKVGSCIEACQAPVAAVQESLGGAQQSFQNRVRRCHEMAGEAVPESSARRNDDGSPSAATVSAYLRSLEPCIAGELRKLPSLMTPIHDRIPRAFEDISRATPATSFDLAKGEKAPSKGYLW